VGAPPSALHPHSSRLNLDARRNLVTYRSLAGLALSTLLAAPVFAATPSFTPPVGAGQNSSAGCLVQNLDAQTRTVTATLRDQGGSSLSTATVDVPPGAVLTLVNMSGAFGVYCEFEGLRRKVRGFVDVNDSTGTLLVLPAGK